VKGTGKEVVVQETETEIETRQIAADQTRIDQEIQEAAEEEIVKEVVIIEVIEKTKVITDQTGIEVTEMGIGIVIGIGIEVEIEANIEAADEVDHVIDHVTESIIHADQGVRIGFLAGILTRKKTLVKALQGIKKWKEVTRKQAALNHLHTTTKGRYEKSIKKKKNFLLFLFFLVFERTCPPPGQAQLGQIAKTCQK
jgi:hypothetical protein